MNRRIKPVRWTEQPHQMLCHISTALSYLPIVALSHEALVREFRDLSHYWICTKTTKP